jgi:hypothetical protein
MLVLNFPSKILFSKICPKKIWEIKRTQILTHFFGRIPFNLVEIQSMTGLFAPIRVKFDRFENISTNFSVSSIKNGDRI